MNAQKKIIWPNLIFFTLTTAFALIGCPLYYASFGISSFEGGLFLFYLFATGMSITAGYHRLFSHASYKANPFVQFFFLFFGAAAFEQSALDWTSQHRDHHRYVDTERDPYSIKKGFFYAHIGWLIFWKHRIHYSNVKDLRKNPMVLHQHRYYHLWAVTSGILLPVALGAFTGHAIGAFLFSVCLRLTLVYHSTFCINSVCHMFGKATYDIYSTAKDHWLVALITNGEGYHNFHHRFPSDYRNGVRWYQWDPTKWLIAALEKIAFTRDLKRVSTYRIIEARLSAENVRVHDVLIRNLEYPDFTLVFDNIKSRYDKLRQCLVDMEAYSREYRMLVRESFDQKTKSLRAETLRKFKEAKATFKETYHQWQDLLKRDPLEHTRFLSAGI